MVGAAFGKYAQSISLPQSSSCAQRGPKSPPGAPGADSPCPSPELLGMEKYYLSTAKGFGATEPKGNSGGDQILSFWRTLKPWYIGRCLLLDGVSADGITPLPNSSYKKSSCPGTESSGCALSPLEINPNPLWPILHR